MKEVWAEILRGIDRNFLTIIVMYFFVFCVILIGLFCLSLHFSKTQLLNSNSSDQLKTKEKDCTH